MKVMRRVCSVHVSKNWLWAGLLAFVLASLPGFAQESSSTAQKPENSMSSSSAAQAGQQAPKSDVDHRKYPFTEFGNAVGHWPNPIGPYKPRDVPQPSFVNTPRMEQLFKDGKIMLSMSDAIALALENNLDLAIARYN